MRPRAISLFVLPLAALLTATQLRAASFSGEEHKSVSRTGVSAERSHAPPISTSHEVRVSAAKTTCSVFGSGDIIPCNEVAVLSTGVQTKNFIVSNHHTSSVHFTVTIFCTGTVSACSISPSGGFTIPANSTHVFVATFTMATGTGHVVVDYESGLDDQGETDNTYSAGTIVALVAPHTGSATVASGSPNAQAFTIKNNGTLPGGFTFAVTCTGAATGCTTPPAIGSLAVGATNNLTVNYVGGASGTGALKLVATPSTGTAKDSGTIAVTVDPATVASLDSVSVPGVVARDHCLTISAGAAAAYECGDLRIVHPLPSTRTKGLAHTPVLLYNSSTAHPFALVANNYTLSAAADSVVATVLMGGVSQGRGSWKGADWTVGATRRIVVGFDAITKRTGYYTDTLQIVRYVGGVPSPATIVAGELMIVNRSGRTADSAYFGRGWWVAGLEQLYNLADGTKLWVGGDGSVRHFMKVTGVSNVWIATAVDGVDGLNFDGVKYTRILPHGLKVRFDATGKHIATVNRLGDSTIFRYDASSRLTAIKLYPDTTRQYVFQYDANGKLAVALAPSVGGVARNDTVTIVSGLLNKIKGPDTTAVSFGYVSGDTNMIATRTDRVGTIATYTYGVAKKLKSFSVDPGFSQTVITLNFSPFETALLSLAGSTRIHALIADSAFTLLDGARRDTSLFWPDRLGEPNRVRNALGYVTMVKRAAGFPGLAAWSRDAKGRVQSATYDAHGNPLVVVDSSTFDPVRSKYAVTTYTWDLLWDFMKRVKLPEGEGQTRSYSATTGNLSWSQPDSDSTVTTRRTTFAYNASGAAKNLLMTVNPPLSAHPDSIGYDNLGNVTGSWSELGFKSRSVVDDIGRVTLTVAPISPTDSLTSTTTFNVVDEDVESRTVGKTTTLSPTDTLVLTKTFDREGRPLDVVRRAAPDTAHIIRLTTRYRYDRIGRKIKDIAPNGANDTTLFDSWVYDAAGNDTSHKTRRNYTIRSTYDLLSRLVRQIIPATTPDSSKIIFANQADAIWMYPKYPDAGSAHVIYPADTLQFAYDAIGSMLSANNGDARITRTYYANGTLATDSSAIRTWAALSAGGNFTTHAYRDSIAYDLDGRRKLLRVPANIAPLSYGTTTPLTDITYSYDGVSGDLTSIHDMMGSDFRFSYTAAQQLDSIGYPGAIGQKFHYDGQHRLASRLEKGPTAFWSGGEIHNESRVYDQRDQLLTVRTPTDSTTNKYSLLGQLTQTRFGSSTTDSVYYGDWTYDALGNRMTYSHRIPPLVYKRNYAYEANTGRIWKSGFATNPFESFEQWGQSTTIVADDAYDKAGNQLLMGTTPQDINGNPTGENVTRSFWDASDHLRAFDPRKCQFQLSDPVCKDPQFLLPSTSGAYEEYRYDALGRRVLVRSRYDVVLSLAPNKVGCSNPMCHSVIERYVWDGNRILTEIRMPGGDSISAANLERDTTTIIDTWASYGRVTYVHGGAIDLPIAIVRNGYTYDSSSTLKSWAGATEVIPH